jgi:hypothetical protein
MNIEHTIARGMQVKVQGFPFITEVIDVRDNYVAVWHDVQFRRGGLTKWVPVEHVSTL